MVKSEEPAQAFTVRAGAVFIITDDGEGFAEALAAELLRLGGRPVIVQHGDSIKKINKGRYQANFEVPEAAAELITAVRQYGPIAGILHLLPFQGKPDITRMKLADWRLWLRLNVKGLFNLVQAAAADLKKTAETGSGWVVSAVASGGNIGYEINKDSPCFPGNGGIFGLINTIAAEWPQIKCKAIGLEREIKTSTLTSTLLKEMATEDHIVEVAYKSNIRYLLGVKQRTLPDKSPQAINIKSDWVIMITGGARGITAEIALELAEKYSPTLILVGRSAPPEEESTETVGLQSAGELKKALINKVKHSGHQPNLVEIEKAYGKICREREMRENISAMERAGARVYYLQADVCNESSFVKTINSIYKKYDRLDGVIHGAGIIEDKLLESKSPESFDRVFDTKADSAFILSRALHPDSLKFLVFFSSIACFGNRGQCDYAATNEVVNKLAVFLDQQWPARIISALWGPWAKTGMASSEVQRQFAEKGIELVQPADGRRWLDQELTMGRKSEVAIVFGSGPWAAMGTDNFSFKDRLPLLKKINFIQSGKTTVTAERILNPKEDLYLNDHVLDKNPVLPMVMAMELMAEVVQQNWSDMYVTSIHSLKVFKGIVVDEDEKKILINASPVNSTADGDGIFEVEAKISPTDNAIRPFYKCIVCLKKKGPTPPDFDYSVFDNLDTFPMPVQDLYLKWLFHGACFQGITTIEGISEQAVCGTLKSIPPAVCLAETPENKNWLLDPVILDSSLQLVILWKRHYQDMTPLPFAIKRYRKFAPFTSGLIHCCVQLENSNKGQLVKADMFFLDDENRLLAMLEGVEASCSKSLNRLAGNS